ncbi:hypothetical protein CAPTEDRAFT_223451 [Capitella teleta]|uniref:RRM domain-containing protein n=1 Tax=Capitella teleta TaxID=283909 RepID=R7V9H5_CAPTE|nr:hypothetical protein CAPTEDRAFT_223451 [Capitella teleta]|eukprot:ELU13011.1 hypothetical protein CAPTEDRAFT_223451 [Capitella teleta]
MSGRGEKPMVDCKIYVGDLPRDASERELERAFSYYGPLKNVWVARNPPGFAFIEYEDPRDADDAVRSLDGSTICGVRARVEHSTGKVRPKPWMRRGGPPGRGGGGSYGRHDDRPSYGGGGARRRRSYSRSRSRSYERRDKKRSYSRSRSRSRSR